MHSSLSPGPVWPVVLGGTDFSETVASTVPLRNANMLQFGLMASRALKKK